MNQPNHIAPPVWPLKLMRFLMKKNYLEEIEGDMEEVFNENVEQFSYRKARRMYTWEMVKLLRPALVKNLGAIHRLNQYGMLENYFKVSIRGLMKNPMNSFINVFGLALAIGVSIFGYAFWRFTYNIDQFHEHKHSVYLTTFFANRDGSEQQFGNTPRPLGEMLRTDFPQIKKVCRVEDRNVVVKYGDNVFHERVRYADPEFLEMFTFPLKWGPSASLKDVNSIVLSEPMAVKYFGEENPVGQNIQVIFGKNNRKEFKVTGVAAAFPEARTIGFDFLINFENFRTSEPGYDFHDWKELLNATLIQVANPADIKSIELRMEKYKALQHAAVQEDWAISSFAFEPLATLHEKSVGIRDDISRSSNGERRSVIYLAVISAFMLALACFNYINIAIGTAAKRLKEIGVRKSIGASRRTVIVQFLSENLVITFFALILGLFIGSVVFIGGFERIWTSFSLDFKLSDPTLWIYLPIILLLTSIASGIYPSIYISRFQVVGILKGSVKFGQRNPLTKVFLTFQLIFACIFITAGVMFTRNSLYMAKRSWGYNQSEAMYAVVPDQASYEKLNSLVAQNPDVVSISGSADHLGKSHTTTVLHFPNREYEVEQLSVDARYFETMGLKLKEGRLFQDHEGSDKRSVIVNELLVKNLAWNNPIGQSFMIDSIQYDVIGVVKDFHSYNFTRSIKPTIFKAADRADYNYLSLKVNPGTEAKVYRKLQASWAQLFPEVPFDGGYQEDVWGLYFEQLGIQGIVWRVIALVAIALAALGLYGLVTLNVEGRTKEFSIRKVLGAGLRNIVVSISYQYVLLFAVALALGAPSGYIVINLLFDAIYPYHMPVNFSSAVIAATIIVFVFLITISTQIRKVFKSNPVNGLKAE